MKFLKSFFLLLILVLLFRSVLAVAPNGATVTFVQSQSNAPSGAGNASAIAGNLTEIIIYSGNAGSQSWQGYYGNVSGTVQLADSTGNIFYNWSAASPEGEVYASTNATVNWANIQCFNFTATGNLSNGLNGETGGATSLYGMNLSQLEGIYTIDSEDLDSVNRTFAAFNHDQFFTSNLLFSANECRSVQLYTNSGAPQDGVFEEVLLYEPSTRSVVFTSVLEDNANGFNNATEDFEMLVLEDGHGSNTATTTYYFFLELQ